MFGPTCISLDRCCADFCAHTLIFKGTQVAASRNTPLSVTAPKGTGSWFDDHGQLSGPITHNDRSNADVGLQTLSLPQFERPMPHLWKLPITPLSFNRPSQFDGLAA
jgi:hypothetical protein